MIVSVGSNEFAVIADYIKKECGIVIPPEKAYLIETRLSKILADKGLDNFGELCAFIRRGCDDTLPERVINAITTNETLWFRDNAPWEAFRREILPRLELDILTKAKRPRIWSAASSTGQEVYSTVMCADDWLSSKGSKASVSDMEFCGTDVSTRVIDIARSGRYDAISVMRGLPPYYKEKYFKREGGAWELDKRVRDAVRFSKFNLLDDFTRLGHFDVIFCRYVLIYFDDILKKAIADKIINALNPGGVLFTGAYALSNLFRDRLRSCTEGNLTYYVNDL